jgi:hypothetical protein
LSGLGHTGTCKNGHEKGRLGANCEIRVVTVDVCPQMSFWPSFSALAPRSSRCLLNLYFL